MHYIDDGTDSNKSNWHCNVDRPERFHTYALEWTSESLTFIYDGQVCLVNRWSPADPMVKPQPFDEPYFMTLSQDLTVGENAYRDSPAPPPVTMRVDYVKVWS